MAGASETGLSDEVRLKEGVDFEQVELAIGEMCNVVKNAYGGDRGGFVAGQVFRFARFASEEGRSEGRGPPKTIWRSSPTGQAVSLLC